MNFLQKKINRQQEISLVRCVVVVVVVVVVVASARCSFLSSVVAEEERTWTGEQCDTRRAKTHACIKKRARFNF